MSNSSLSVVMRYVESTAPPVAMDSVRRRLAPGLALSALTPVSDHETHYTHPPFFLQIGWIFRQSV